MARARKKPEVASNYDRAPATSPEEQESRMISLSMNLAEQQLRDGTASAQVITHYLKLATVREKLEQEKLRKEILALQAKADSLESMKQFEELTREAIAAIRSYNGDDNDKDL